MKYRIDPELLAFAKALPETDFSDPQRTRAGFEEMVAQMAPAMSLDELQIEDRSIPGPQGAPEVKVRIYTPRNKPASAPGLLYIHGGGFVVGSLETEHFGVAALAQTLSITAVSVDYRLAPENPFPAGMEDCYAALLWTHENAASLGIDADRLGVCGSSAGGGLSAAVTLLARDRKGPTLCFQFLGIPELDDRLNTPSMRQFTDTPVWNRPNAEYSWKFYLGDAAAPGSDAVSPYAAPARMENLRDLPPAYISVAEFDPLRDEGILYGMRLLEAGVPVELHCYPGTYHGSFMFGDAAISLRQNLEMIEALRAGLGVKN